MANSKVILNEETLIDLTSNTVVPSSFESGYIATSSNGEKISGISRRNNANNIIIRAIDGVYENSTVGTVGSYAFASCYSLTEVSMAGCSVLSENAFSACTKLQNVYLHNVTHIGSSAFRNCTSLTSAIFPNAIFVGQSAFDGCSTLSSVSFPLLQNVSFNTFRSCYSLHTVILPRVSEILAYGFSMCQRLISLYLLSSSIVSLGGSAVFSSTPIGGYSTIAGQYGNVYVRASLLTGYQTANNWSDISSRIVGITDAQISDLQM